MSGKERVMNVLLGPHVSEKGTRLAEDRHQVVFKVRRDAHKDEIRRAVEMLFDVKVSAVNVLNQRGKRKRFAAGVVAFALTLRDSPYKGSATYDLAAGLVGRSLGTDPSGRRAELLSLIQKARNLAR